MIYPVRLIKWFPRKSEDYKSLIYMRKCMYCAGCGKSMARSKYKNIIGHHSLPYGHGDMWHNDNCFRKVK